jgi:hypothetical protein
LRSLFHPRIPEIAYAAASGAVIADDIPAAKRPTPIKYLDHPPITGSSCTARSEPLEIATPVPKKATADVTTIAIEINPPRITDIEISSLASGISSGLFHLC